jgi:hypothetical protein
MLRQRPLPHRLLLAPPLRLSLPLRPCRALRMYAGCPCPHAIQLPEVAANAPRQRQVLSLLHQRAVLWLRGHDKHFRGTAGSYVRTLVWKSYMSLTARTTTHPAQDNLRLMAHSRRANAKIFLVGFHRHLLSRVLGHPSPWLTQRQCDLPRTNQRRFPLPLSFAERKLRFRFSQRWEFTAQFICLSVWRIISAWTCLCAQPDSGHRRRIPV